MGFQFPELVSLERSTIESAKGLAVDAANGLAGFLIALESNLESELPKVEAEVADFAVSFLPAVARPLVAPVLTGAVSIAEAKANPAITAALKSYVVLAVNRIKEAAQNL